MAFSVSFLTALISKIETSLDTLSDTISDNESKITAGQQSQYEFGEEIYQGLSEILQTLNSLDLIIKNN